LIDVVDGAFVLRKINNGIQGDYQPPTNRELVDLTRKHETSRSGVNNLGIPWGYAPAVFSQKLLENDFKKNLVCYEWTPDSQALSLSNRAFKLITIPYLNGCVRELDDVVSFIDRTTSPGYPLNLKYDTKGAALDGEMPLIREIVSQIKLKGRFDVQFHVREGYEIRWFHVFYLVSPKGELRTVDKLMAEKPEDRKTRTFMCGDLILQLVCLMLYHDQNDSFLGMAGEREWSAVGMTPWYGGWNLMANYIQSGGEVDPDICCLDVQHMEASVVDHIQIEIDETRNEALLLGNLAYGEDPGILNLMSWAHRMMTELYIIGVNGWLYFRTCVNPSGKLNTATDNTMALMRVLLYCIAIDCKTVGELLAIYYNSPAKLFGDDSIIQWQPWVDQIIDRAKHLGFSMKFECPRSKLKDARFLNAGFYRSASMWYFMPNFEKIRASIFFVFKSRSWRLTYVKVCAYRQLVFPYKVYRDEADRFLRYIIRHHDDDMRNEHSMDSKITYASARASLMSDADNQFLCAGLEGSASTNDHLRRLSRSWAAAEPTCLTQVFSDVQ